MKVFGPVAMLLLAGSPLAAQDNATATPPTPADNIGPRELSNFSLNGTVTREAQPEVVRPPADSGQATFARPAESDRRQAVRPAASAPRQAEAPENPVLDPVSTQPSLRGPSSAAPAAAAGASALAPPITAPPPFPTESSSGFSPLPWIAALLVLGAGAVLYFGRRRQKQRYAGGGITQFVGHPPEAPPAATPIPAARQPEPRSDPPQAPPAGLVTSNLRKAPANPPGLVTSSLRPWIELELEPSKALITDEQAAIAFDVTLYNSGSAPARDVAIDTCLINAGEQQDVELSKFYTAPGEVGDRIPSVAPLARIKLKSAVRLPRSAIHEYEVEGRKLFMPMVAVNSRYRWSSGEGQSAASFLVGRAANDSAKLAPLRLDQGSRGWKGLAARRYEKGIRK